MYKSYKWLNLYTLYEVAQSGFIEPLKIIVFIIV